ncbi:flavodoxin domain-containing protein [Tessaracoccus flavus]|uniref:Uncharacterized protein n=1 Tax=Tessaracoccus flavus TaxID=1610493 RepID=A0A1Q2CHS2_9ACTN|nr:flavodoxin domain-containing protein [Tessaracoccus flavus]AQP45669.1 hypothetical protein RPIT_13320 [Tessaracoccus flavus]SDY75618.1 menaquinone-dependent protoporphyrinogen oxidase [Tessaracoccus flavus]
MATVLVAYATRGGTAHDIAEAVADVARDAGHDVTVADLRDKPHARADLVVVGSGVNAGSWYPEAVAWLARHTDTLRGTKVALFNACLNAADPAKREDSLAYNKVGVDRVGAVSSEAFAGRYVPHRVGWFRRVFLKTMQQQPQDHLDLDRVRAWAQGLLAQL